MIRANCLIPRFGTYKHVLTVSLPKVPRIGANFRHDSEGNFIVGTLKSATLTVFDYYDPNDLTAVLPVYNLVISPTEPVVLKEEL